MDIADFLISMGLPGVVILAEAGVVVWLWKALDKERARCSDLTDKMLDLTRDHAEIVERIVGR